MARIERTKQDKLLQQMRTQSLLAHVIHSSGYLNKQKDSISLPTLVNRLIQIQGSREVVNQSDDFFSERRISRWITGESAAGRDLDDLLSAWDQGTFKGAIWAYYKGPVRSRFFEALTEPLESETFYIAADTEFEELFNQGKSLRLSELLSNRLEELQAKTENTPETILHYLTATTAWFRYALITMHSMSYLVYHVNDALSRLKLIQTSIEIQKKGHIFFPLSSELYCNYLVEMLSKSVRYRKALEGIELAAGENSWRKVCLEIAPDEFLPMPLTSRLAKRSVVT